MIHFVPVTQMKTGTPTMVSVHGIKMIEETTYKAAPAVPVMAAGKDGKMPETTQTVQPVSAAVEAIPIQCSMITFHDDHTLLVKETMAAIVSAASAA